MNKKTNKTDQYEYKYKKEYEEDWDIHRNYINTFNPYEAMLVGAVYDSVSKSVDSAKITDSYAATLAIERAARVMGKLPTGETQSVAKADVGKAAFMDILRQKWIYPNANSQHNFDTKLRLWQLYSSVYGYMPMFYDWNVSNTGYVGPDCWLWNPRNLIPQQGRTSIGDMDYVTALTWVSKKFIDRLLDKSDTELEDGGWERKALLQLADMAENETSTADQDKDTFVERDRISQATKKGICIATRYESGPDGEWVSFAPDHSCLEIRKIKNPHKNGRIPFVIKYSQPLFDSFYGLGDFQRAKPLQFARDGLTNFYFASLKRNLAPGIIVNANGVMKHTLDVTSPNPILMETIANSIRPMPTNSAGLSTYQGAMSNLTGSLLSLYGSQNASTPGAETLNPSQGKTPAAIDLYSDKEATRDGQERMYLEGAIEELTDGFFSLVANIGTEDIPVNLFEKDIEEINEAGLTDIMGLFTTNPFTGEEQVGSSTFRPDATMTAGELVIKPGSLKGVEYRFNITPGSTAKANKEKQLADLERLMGNIGKFQNIFKDDPRVDVNWGAMTKAYEELSDLDGVQDFITIKEGPSPQELQQQQEEAQRQQEMQMQAQQQQHEMGMAEMQANQPVPPTPTNAGLINDPDIAGSIKQIEGM